MRHRPAAEDEIMTTDAGVLELIGEFRQGNATALARVISIVENDRIGSERIMNELGASTGSAYRIGITGAPGVGKSTLTAQMIQQFRRRDMTVAGVVVDPSSSLTGGALLGDRIRMDQVVLDPGVFVRSMATRGALGGLAKMTHQVCDVLDAFGFDRIIIETVGTGQADLAVVDNADVTVLVLVPESGDGVQVLKAGIMEVADIFVVNKADRPGANQRVTELRELVEILAASRHATEDAVGRVRNPLVLKTVATESTGVTELVEMLEQLAVESKVA